MGSSKPQGDRNTDATATSGPPPLRPRQKFQDVSDDAAASGFSLIEPFAGTDTDVSGGYDPYNNHRKRRDFVVWPARSR